MPFLLTSENILPYLTQIGLWHKGQLPAALEPKAGKNFNLRVRGEHQGKAAQDFLIKQEPHGPYEQPAGELYREHCFYRLLETFPALSGLKSQTTLPLHFDADSSIIVFPYLSGVIDLSAFYRRYTEIEDCASIDCASRSMPGGSTTMAGILPSEVGAAIGKTLASLHSNTFQQEAYRSFWIDSCEQTDSCEQDDGDSEDDLSELASDSVASDSVVSDSLIPDFLIGLRRLTPETFCVLPTDALKFFRFYQHYPKLGEAIAQLNQAFQPCCVVHDDPRFANFLLASTGSEASSASVQLIDWEKWKWGDPAYDLGKLTANYLKLWLESLPVSASMPLSQALNRASVPLSAVQPSTAALVTAYFAHFPEILTHQPNFLIRLTQFAGLGLIRQIQLYISHKAPIGNVEMAMAQVGKSLLCQPEGSISTVFGQSRESLELRAIEQNATEQNAKEHKQSSNYVASQFAVSAPQEVRS